MVDPSEQLRTQEEAAQREEVVVLALVPQPLVGHRVRQLAPQSVRAVDGAMHQPFVAQPLPGGE